MLEILIAAVIAAAPQEETNVASVLAGACEFADGACANNTLVWALDGQADSDWEIQAGGERSAILRLAEPADLTAVEVINSFQEAGYPGLSTKVLKLEQGPSAEGPWAPLAELKLVKGAKPQRSKLAAKKVRFVRVTAVSNHGSEEWTALAELALLGKPSAPRKIDFNGVWDTNYGEMVLTQTGARVTGCYATSASTKAGDCVVDGTLEGATFAGTWREGEGESAHEGLMVFALTAEGNLSGVWGRSAGDRTSRWDGTRKAKATVVCEKPERDLVQELNAKGRIVLHGILFDTGKDTIKAESESVLKELAAAMKAKPDQTYLIEGHTDDRGGVESNQDLSERRAGSVKAWLEKAGVQAKLKPIGFGMSRPAVPNTTDGGRAANRRVEVALEKE